MRVEEFTIEEGLKSNAAIAALVAALTATPASATGITDNPMSEPVPQTQEQEKDAWKSALTIFRSIQNVKDLSKEGMSEEARVEFNNILRFLQGMPNQSKTYPVVKDIFRDRTI